MHEVNKKTARDFRLALLLLRFHLLLGLLHDSQFGVEDDLVFLLVHIHLDHGPILELAAEQSTSKRNLHIFE